MHNKQIGKSLNTCLHRLFLSVIIRVMEKNNYLHLIDYALSEDLGEDGDVTSEAIFSMEKGKAVLLSKDTGVLAGSFLFSDVFARVDESVSFSFHKKDGDSLFPGDRVALLEGPVRSLLTAERTALNFISLLSGIATRTAQFVKAASDTGRAVILDTRKTIPGFRALSKYAVRMGGGHNHRMGLFDMVLIKDNHIDAAGGITRAVTRIKERWNDRFRIEVECRTLEEVKEALSCGVQVIMLDNMDPHEITAAVKVVDGKVKLEASGLMDLDKTGKISPLGIDYISSGMLTKSVTSFDFSLDITSGDQSDE